MEGVDLSDLKVIDELRSVKREMHNELEMLRTQVKGFKVLFGQQAENDSGIPEDPRIALG